MGGGLQVPADPSLYYLSLPGDRTSTSSPPSLPMPSYPRSAKYFLALSRYSARLVGPKPI